VTRLTAWPVDCQVKVEKNTQATNDSSCYAAATKECGRVCKTSEGDAKIWAAADAGR
jgi:hypothetical protein